MQVTSGACGRAGAPKGCFLYLAVFVCDWLAWCGRSWDLLGGNPGLPDFCSGLQLGRSARFFLTLGHAHAQARGRALALWVKPARGLQRHRPPIDPSCRGKPAAPPRHCLTPSENPPQGVTRPAERPWRRLAALDGQWPSCGGQWALGARRRLHAWVSPGLWEPQPSSPSPYVESCQFF